MNKLFLLGLIIGLILVSCTDPNTIGLEVHPPSDIILIESNAFQELNSKSESEDSLRSDEALNLILGEIEDPMFKINTGNFYSQILLAQNNIDLGINPTVDSVVLSYTYSGYYGEPANFIDLEVYKIAEYENLYKDSIYYSNSDIDVEERIDQSSQGCNLSANSENPFIRVNLTDEFGEEILQLGTEGKLIDNETFLEYFKGIRVSASTQSPGCIFYLNPDGSNSYLKIYYHNNESGTDTLSLDFDLGGDAARINWFNEKNYNSILEDNSRIYIQSMGGYKARISISSLDSIKPLLDGKVINKVMMIFNVEGGSQTDYEAHEKLVLVRVNEEGENIFLADLGDPYFGGDLDNDKYEFNITRYFFQLLNNESYTNDLYLLPAGAVVNANRTILDKAISLEIYYSEL